MIDDADNENEEITYTVDPDANMHGTSLKMQDVKVPFHKLVELFGEPQRHKKPDRSRVYWNISFSDGEVLSVYDWNSLNVPVEQVDQWNVGAHSFIIAYRFRDILDGNPITNW